MTKKFDPTKPVQTRDGRKARIICTDVNDKYYPIMALVEDSDGTEYAVSSTVDGHARYQRDGELPQDLVNIPPAVYSVNYRILHGWGGIGTCYNTLDEVIRMKNVSSNVCGIIKITTYDDNTFDIEKVDE